MRNHLTHFVAGTLCLLTLTACSAQSGGDMEGANTATGAGAPAESYAPDFNPDFNTEEYSAITENDYRAVANAPLSTFSADVDTASYSNIRRMLLEGQAVPADAVRLEEMINYFRYEYPEPQPGEPFSVTTELAGCPWNPDSKLLLIGLQAQKLDADALPPSNLVFLIDVSGSMEAADKLPLVRQAFGLLCDVLGPDDTVSIVTYAGSDSVVLNGTPGSESAAIREAIESLDAGGATAGAQGIETAYRIAEENFIEGGNNRIVLATDGDLNVGVTSEGELKRLVEEKRESGIFLSVLGFGSGNIKDNKMEALADNGNGNYAYIDSIIEARRVLVEEMGGTLFTVAKDVKIQVEFNPAAVKGYRLIGYENRLLNPEDFADDAKDAGELGSGHRVTALYELVPVDSPMEIPQADLKYQQTAPAGGAEEWLTVSLRYKEPDGDQSREITVPVRGEQMADTPSDNFRLAACVAQFGMLLRQSPYRGSASYDGIINTLSQLPGVQSDPYQDELLSLVKRASRLYQ